MGAIKGLDKLLKDLEDLPVNLEKEMNVILADNSRQLARSAIRFAPYDFGKLKQSIRAVKGEDLSWKVVVMAKYGAYMEFGTGGLVRVPEEMQEMAIQFLGKGVRQVNLKPQPYLYPAFELQRDQYINDLQDLLDREIKRIK